ncbi:MSC_0624 family F1-like ATPase-associated membrane protein [Mycoplasmopsis gallinacea]|uniref:Uncharacterized protein n=1 Tax=Mycoplasmopsis gallinacea TaxID=29556 RepID=A0A449A3W8_9BACT|nr:hypothetical protein [Mycoplasmopsis gallinacea]VEU58912.1 Uncharacterised protein [Mycoplasmopsis gallinacea]
MTNTNTIPQRKIFSQQMVKNIYKNLILLILFVGILFTLFTFSNYVGNDIVNAKSNDVFVGYENLFNLSNPVFKSRNFAIIFNFTILITAFIYGVYSGYRVWRYSLKNTYSYAFSVVFVIVAIASIILLAIDPINYETDPQNLIIKSVPIIVLLLISCVFEFLLFNNKRKISPSTMLLNVSFFASALLKLFLTIIGFVLLYLFVSDVKVSANEKAIDYLFFSGKNEMFKKIDYALNTNAGGLSFLYHFVLITIALAAIFLSIYPYFFGSYLLNRRKNIYKDLTKIALVSSFAVLIFALANVTKSVEQSSFVVKNSISHIGYLSFSAVAVIIIGSYIAITKFFKNQLNHYNIDSFLLALALLTPFSIAIILRTINFDKFNNYIILVLLSLFVLVLFVYQNFNKTTLNKNNHTIFAISLLLLSLGIFFEVVDAFMIEKGNHLLSSIFILIHLSDILLITNLVFIFGLVITRLYGLFKLFYFIKKVASKKLKLKNVN